MSAHQSVPCLLLLAADASKGSGNSKSFLKSSLAYPDAYSPFPSRSRMRKPRVKGYALLPQAFKNGHPEVLEEFSRKHIQVLSKDQDYFPKIVEPTRHYLFEAAVELSTAESETELASTSSESEIKSVSLPVSVQVLIGVNNVPTVCSKSKSVVDKKDECTWLKKRFGNLFNFHDRNLISTTGIFDEENLEVIKRLILDGADIEYGLNRGSIWHFAVERGQEALIMLLLRKKVPVQAGKARGWDTLLDNSGKEGFVKIVELLLKHGHIDPNSSAAAIALSALLSSFSDTKRIEMCRLLLELWAKDNMNDNIHRLLRRSVVQHWPDFVELILSFCPSLSDELNKGTFHIAFLHRKEGGKALECFEKMEKYGFRIDFDVETSSLLLIGAIVNDWVDVVQKLVANGADVNAVFTYEGSDLPEEERTYYYEIDDRKKIFATDWRDLSDFEGPFSIFDWQFREGNKLFEKVIYRKASDYDKRLPCLVLSLERERYSKILLSHKNYTPLHIAAVCAGESVIEALIKNGANVNAQLGKRSPIYDAVEAHNINAVKLLIDNGANVRHKPELIWYAVSCGHSEIVELLLLNRVLLSSEDSELQKLLAIAVAEDSMEVLDTLLKFGARANADFALRRSREFGYHAEKMLQSVLDRCFTIGDYNAAVKITDFVYTNRRRDPFVTCCRPRPQDYDHKVADIGSYHDTSVRYKIKLKAAGLKFDDQTDYSSSSQGNGRDYFLRSRETVDEYQKICVAEVEKLNNERVGNMDATFYDILTGTVHQLAVFAKHVDFVETIRKGDYKNKFPVYSSVLSCQFTKGTYRRELLDRGSKICSSLSVVFNQLPDTVKDKIMMHLNNYYLEVLTYEFERFLTRANEN